MEEEGGEEIRRRAAEQAEKWLVKLRGDLEEKKRERERGETKEREEWKTGRGTDFMDEGRVRMKQMNVGQERGG